MYYFVPIWIAPLQNWQKSSQPLKLSKLQQLSDDVGKQQRKIKSSPISYQKLYFQKFKQELQILYKRQKKKVWTFEEDQILLNLSKEQADWKYISKFFLGVNSEICKRRYYRLLQHNLRWPTEVDQLIRHMRQVKLKKWVQIAQALHQNFGNCGYTGKKIKQRYQFYLRQGIRQKQWTIEEDIKLLKSVHQKGRYWKAILPDFCGRTQLQLKNRFNGTLKLVQRRVLESLKQYGFGQK